MGVAVVMFTTVGVGFYGLAVFLRPLQEENGWSNSAVSGATGMYFSVTGVTGYILGPFIDRNGPIRYMTVGVFLVGVSAILLGAVDQLWQLYAVYFLQAVAFGLAGAVAVNSIIARWFVTKRAKAMSISSTGVSLGGVILSPLGAWLIGVGGIALAAPAMGVLVLVVGIPIVTLVLAWDPADVGLTPDAGRPDERAVGEATDEGVQRRLWTRGEAARTRAFWTILSAFWIALVAQTGFLLHQIAFLTDRFESENKAALALSTTAFGSIIARFAMGMVADRLNKTRLSAGLFLTQGLAIAGLLAIPHTITTYLFVLIVGFTIGNIYMMQTLLVAEKFGLVSLGTVYGVVALAAQIGSGVGPFAIGWLEDQTGDYTLPFAVGAGLMVVAAVLVLFTNSPVAENGA